MSVLILEQRSAAEATEIPKGMGARLVAENHYLEGINILKSTKIKNYMIPPRYMPEGNKVPPDPVCRCIPSSKFTFRSMIDDT